MAGNTIGKIFCLTTFGESHGPAVGGIVDGFPAGLSIDTGIIQKDLDRRRPGLSHIASPRREDDDVEILSGLFEGMSTGTPIAFMIRNKDARPADYEAMRDLIRPSHADYTYRKKYGIHDFRGGGRASARETAARVAGGALAKIFLKSRGIEIIAYTSAIAGLRVEADPLNLDPGIIEANPLRCPDSAIAAEMLKIAEKIRAEGDTAGSSVSCVIRGVPAGLGEPVFDKLNADLAKAMLSINACKGIEFGSGFSAISQKGSTYNDTYHLSDPEDPSSIVPQTNHEGGILGGISTGMPVIFRLAFKPVASIAIEQQTLDIHGKPVVFRGRGRHDAVIAPRAVPVVEAMAALTIADHLLRFDAFRR